MEGLNNVTQMSGISMHTYENDDDLQAFMYFYFTDN